MTTRETTLACVANLTHGTDVRLPGWDHSTASVGTLAGYCTPEQAARSRGRGDPEAWTTFAGHIIANDPSVYQRQRARHAFAVVVNDGDIVGIDGKPYRVVVNRGNHASPRNSDPIAFVPVEG